VETSGFVSLHRPSFLEHFLPKLLLLYLLFKVTGIIHHAPGTKFDGLNTGLINKAL
jgi:hypothetical protein